MSVFDKSDIHSADKFTMYKSMMKSLNETVNNDTISKRLILGDFSNQDKISH